MEPKYWIAANCDDLHCEKYNLLVQVWFISPVEEHSSLSKMLKKKYLAILMLLLCFLISFAHFKGNATCSDENEQKSFTGQHETISFIATPATQKQRHTSIS